jgi:hypothetical protein
MGGVDEWCAALRWLGRPRDRGQAAAVRCDGLGISTHAWVPLSLDVSRHPSRSAVPHHPFPVRERLCCLTELHFTGSMQFGKAHRSVTRPHEHHHCEEGHPVGESGRSANRAV